MEREAKRLVPNVSQRTSRHIQVADRTIAVRAMLIKSESLRDAIDRALPFAFNPHRTVASLIPEYRQFPSKLLNPAPV
jgi:hypothetical protein